MNQIRNITPTLLAEGLVFGEGTRWRDGKLYLSDMLGKRVVTVDASGHIETVVEVPHQPNGLAFMADGTLLYSSMFDNKLYCVIEGKSDLYADLSGVMTGYTGDMVIDAVGRVYVDDVGARVLHGEPPRPGRLILVDTDRSVRVIVDELLFPNGIAISPNGKTMFVGETHNHRVLRFDVLEDGSLRNRRTFVDTFDLIPILGGAGDGVSFPWVDGICMDAEEGLWLSMFTADMFVRVDKHAKITHMIRMQGEATACTLGGPDGRTLFMACNQLPAGEDKFEAMAKGRSKCRIMTAEVDFPKGDTRP